MPVLVFAASNSENSQIKMQSASQIKDEYQEGDRVLYHAIKENGLTKESSGTILKVIQRCPDESKPIDIFQADDYDSRYLIENESSKEQHDYKIQQIIQLLGRPKRDEEIQTPENDNEQKEMRDDASQTGDEI